MVAFGVGRKGATFVPCFGFGDDGRPAALVIDLRLVRPER